MLNDWTNNQWIQFIPLSLSIIHNMPIALMYKLIWIDLYCLVSGQWFQEIEYYKQNSWGLFSLNKYCCP